MSRWPCVSGWMRASGTPAAHARGALQRGAAQRGAARRSVMGRCAPTTLGTARRSGLVAPCCAVSRRCCCLFPPQVRRRLVGPVHPRCATRGGGVRRRSPPRSRWHARTPSHRAHCPGAPPRRAAQAPARRLPRGRADGYAARTVACVQSAGAACAAVRHARHRVGGGRAPPARPPDRRAHARHAAVPVRARARWRAFPRPGCPPAALLALRPCGPAALRPCGPAAARAAHASCSPRSARTRAFPPFTHPARACHALLPPGC